jgi:hypothetical protein
MMNERIRELARRVVGKNKNDVNSISLFDEQIDHFAELILTDVVETIKQSAGSHLMLNTNEMEVKEIQLKVEGALAAMAAVSRHFKSESKGHQNTRIDNAK